jgi:nucleotide-binding universal stress UspA family protein
MSDELIVVGVDGSPASLAAMHAAYEEARLRHAPLHVVTAWQLAWSEIAIDAPVVVKKIVEHNADILESALATVDHGRPEGIDVSGELRNGDPATELLDAASDATLLVVGTRGTSGLVGTLIGSVAHAAIQHAKCPVLIVPPARDVDAIASHDADLRRGEE